MSRGGTTMIRRGRALPWLLLPLACGLAAANNYYAQPLLAPIGAEFGVGTGGAALLLSAVQLGYAAGLVLLAPLGDVAENRGLISRMLVLAALALAGVAVSPWFGLTLVCGLFVGVMSAVVQIIVPYAVSTGPAGHGGRIIGRLMIGLLLGVLLARPASSLLASAVGWRGVFVAAAVVALLLALAIRLGMPAWRPALRLRYPALLRSALALLGTEPALRRRLRCHVLLFCAFSAFWTCVGFVLLERAGFSLAGLALFALVGAGGALAAPLAGRLGDRGFGIRGTSAAIWLAVGASVLALVAGSMFSDGLAGAASVVAIALFVVAALVLDGAVQASVVFGQREIMAARPDSAARINGVFIAGFFVAGAVASAGAGALYAVAGWDAVAGLMVAVTVAAGVVWAIDVRALRRTVTGASGRVDEGKTV